MTLENAIAEIRQSSTGIRLYMNRLQDGLNDLEAALAEIEREATITPEPMVAEESPVTELTLWCDGGLRGPNPGSELYGSYAFGDVKETVEFGVKGSNNTAEYLAFIAGMEAVAKIYDPATVNLTVYMDSDLVRLQVCGAWRVKAEHLRPLRNRARRQLDDFADWRIQHTPREDIVAILGH